MLAFSKRNVGLSRRALTEAAAVCGACWAISFVAPFVTEAGGDSVDLTMATMALSAFVVGVAIVSRGVNAGWAGIFGAVLFAGVIWAVSFGIYAEHAWGWQDLRLEDIDSTSDLWISAFFFAPTAALPGGLVGVLGSMMWRRMRTMSAPA